MITTAPSRHGNSLFIDNDVCSYVIRNPEGMGPRDWMWVEVTKVDKTLAAITKGYDYKYKERNPLRTANDRKFGMLRGLDYYVIFKSISVYPGNFRMRTWIERAAAPPPQQQTSNQDPNNFNIDNAQD